jgi:HK97 gp10 family phage protein
VRVSVEYDRLDESRREVRRELDRALSRGAEATQRTSQSIVPVLTGKLRSSISTSKVGDLAYDVYTDVEYAPYVESGTRNMAAQPYMRPAYERNRLKVIEDCSDVLD